MSNLANFDIAKIFQVLVRRVRNAVIRDVPGNSLTLGK